VGGRSRRRHAVVCEKEAAGVRSHRQCGVDEGRRSVGAVRLSLAHPLGGTSDQLDLERFCRSLFGRIGKPCAFRFSSGKSA
jgi:hypothetical protein